MPTLEWIGKSAVINHHREVAYRLLHCDPELSVGDPNSGNLLVQGDNLLALKALLPYYAGKVKCIYIDPPYNTGNESWVYNDNVNSPEIKKWLGEIVKKEADDLSRHDKWLCMMYPRLALLKDFLTEDGAIFISIDDNELHHLRAIMDEIFGPRNFLACVANVNNPKGRSDDKYIATAHEYVLIYKQQEVDFTGWKPEERVIKRYNKYDSDGQRYREIDLRKTGDNDRREDRENLFYYFMYNSNSGDFYPTREETERPGYVQIRPLRDDGSEGNWRWGLETASERIHILIPKKMPVRKVWSVFEKDYLDINETVKPTSAWTKKDFNSERGTEQFISLGFDKKAFAKPKPIGLLTHIFSMITDTNSLILDSFSGSGSTGHSILQLNKEDGGNRRFILVEMEPDICQNITYGRLKRVVEGYNDSKGHVDGLDGGFRYCKLGEPLFDEDGRIRESVKFSELAAHVFFTETGSPIPVPASGKTPFLGVHESKAIYLLFNGVLGDKKPDGGNVLTNEVFSNLPKHDGLRIIYGEGCHLSAVRLRREGIVFKQVPYEIKVR